MRVMLLAAGKGERLRPLTLTTPKPLLQAGQQTLLMHWLKKLELHRPTEVIINVAYLGEQIIAFCRQYSGPLNLRILDEGEPLETGGALLNALPYLGDDPIMLINADVYCEFPLKAWFDSYSTDKNADVNDLLQGKLAHFLLVGNPPHHPAGDFALQEHDVLLKGQSKGLTFAGLSVLHPQLIKSYPNTGTNFPLREVFFWAIGNKAVSGEYYSGYWLDVGTQERLVELDAYLRGK